MILWFRFVKIVFAMDLPVFVHPKQTHHSRILPQQGSITKNREGRPRLGLGGFKTAQRAQLSGNKFTVKHFVKTEERQLSHEKNPLTVLLSVILVV